MFLLSSNFIKGSPPMLSCVCRAKEAFSHIQTPCFLLYCACERRDGNMPVRGASLPSFTFPGKTGRMPGLPTLQSVNK